MSKAETAKPDEAIILADLMNRVAAQGDRTASLTTLVAGLADQIKATSNDQNIQRLARALRVAAPVLVETIASKSSVSNSNARSVQ